MKHIALCGALAALLAAALLAGCGAASSQMTREEGSIAGPPAVCRRYGNRACPPDR